jgi:hypothetical protein
MNLLEIAIGALSRYGAGERFQAEISCQKQRPSLRPSRRRLARSSLVTPDYYRDGGGVVDPDDLLVRSRLGKIHFSFVAQDKAIGQLYKYWEQPLTTSYLLMAERIAENVSTSRREDEMAKLIDQLLLISQGREVQPGGKAGATAARSAIAPPTQNGKDGEPAAKELVETLGN